MKKLLRSLSPRMVRWVRVVGFPLVAFVVGAVLCWLLLGPGAGSPSNGAEKQETAGKKPEKKSVKWTCVMHTWIRRDGPGKCPVCGMKLVPVNSSGGEMTDLRQLTVSPAARALMSIQVAPVERRYVAAVVRMVGKVDYDETRLKYITAWVAGRLDRLFVNYTGVQVKMGDHMVSMYSEELYAAQQELITSIRSARAAKKSGSRFFATGGVDLVKSTREKLRLWGMTPEQIAEIEKRDKPSDHMTIYSPMSGVVIKKMREEGDRVRVGDRIYTVADLSEVWVKMDAYESDLVWLRYGQKVTFTTEAYPGRTFEGLIAFIDPVLNEKTRTVKVRVNLPNTGGRLKPEMFVSGEVKAEVALGGRVMDPTLAGKWISPMHPEIVRDRPGKCPICGMPLVRAESLGYISPVQSAETKPLVIPVSAALITGTRAVVYVEDPKAEQPTFYGREIVLGPRAGDYYLVKHGLQEGELVVTRGNFKIDAEIQIRAKPSMMTPAGGGGGGHHHHGGGSSHKRGTPTAAHSGSQMDVPAAFGSKLGQLNSAYARIETAVKAGNAKRTQDAFKAFGSILKSIDLKMLSGHAKMQWKEFAMLLGNDVAEGRDAVRPDEIRRIFLSLSGTMRRVTEMFGPFAKEPVRQRFKVPVAFQSQLKPLWDGYLTLGRLLAKDNFPAAQKALPQFVRAVDVVNRKLLTDSAAHQTWLKELGNLKTISRQMAEARDLKNFRDGYELLSGEMQVLALTFGFGKAVPVYQLHCPMAFGGKGAVWLQATGKARNPYLGLSMPKCADRVERIHTEP